MTNPFDFLSENISLLILLYKFILKQKMIFLIFISLKTKTLNKLTLKTKFSKNKTKFNFLKY